MAQFLKSATSPKQQSSIQHGQHTLQQHEQIQSQANEHQQHAARHSLSEIAASLTSLLDDGMSTVPLVEQNADVVGQHQCQRDNERQRNITAAAEFRKYIERYTPTQV